MVAANSKKEQQFLNSKCGGLLIVIVFNSSVEEVALPLLLTFRSTSMR